jgi:hypothetical protein
MFQPASVPRLPFALLALLSLVLFPAVARAHFLFIHIGPAAEAGRAAEVFFSERAVAGDPRFADKIAPTKLWVQTAPGQFTPLEVRQGHDRLRASLPLTGNLIVVGQLDYGVLERPLQKPFLLRHYCKAMAGDPAELEKLTPRPEATVEIVGVVRGDSIELQALRDGQPFPGAKFSTVDADLIGDELVADDQGRATWKPGGTGRQCVYMSNTRPVAGEHDGKPYQEIREFATLAFNWPLNSQETDAEAIQLFDDALAARARWKDFPGFTAKLEGVVEGRSFAGSAKVDSAGAVSIESDDEVAQEWAQDALRSLCMHRIASDTNSTPSRLRFADDDLSHPLGRLLAYEGGEMASSYRIKDQQIMVVNRHFGPKLVTITVLDNDRNPDGAFLPRSYSVQTWDTASGKLLETETVQNRWQRVGSFDLPTLHQATTASDLGQVIRTIQLTDHALLTK